MIYYYTITIQYICGKERFIKEYVKSFAEIGELFVFLETKHRDNYTVISIKPKYPSNRYMTKM